jgi:hypothetical protein
MSHADDMPDEGTTAFDRAYLLALDDHNRGVAKEIDEYLRFVRAEERAELASLIASTLTRRTPTGASAADFAAGYEHAMAAIVTVEGSAGLTGILPGALENMSRARGIEPDAVVGALAAEFDITSDEGRSALRRYYHRVRTGRLLGSRITHRLLAALARIFDAEPEDFIAAVRPVGAAPRLSVAPAMPRPSGESHRTPTRAAAEPANAHPDEELVKRLFCGGPDA